MAEKETLVSNPNPNTTPTYEQQGTDLEVLAQCAGDLATTETTEVVKVHEWTTLTEPATLAQWPGFDRTGEPKLSRQGRYREKLRQQLGSQPVDVAGEEDRFFNVA